MISVRTEVVKHKVLQYLLHFDPSYEIGGATGTRTPDPLLAKQVL